VQKGTVIEYAGPRGKTFRVQYRDASGRQVKETLGHERDGWTKRKAQAELADRISRVANKNYRRPKPVTFGSFADRWFEESQGPKGWSPATVTKYSKAVSRLKDRFGPMRLRDIRRSHVRGYLADLLRERDGKRELGERTANITITVLHSILDAAIEEELLDAPNVAKGVRAIEPDYKPRSLTPEEAQLVRANLKTPQVKLAFLTLELLGLRWSELTGLRWRDIDLVESRLRVAESKTPTGERWLALPSMLRDEFAKHKERSHYSANEDYALCHPEKGSRWGDEHYREEVHKALKAAGIHDRFRPAHDLRVTSLTEGALAGESPVVLMARAGHRSFATTKRYLDLAGVVFKDEAEKLAARRLGTTVEVES
jgi:integrase